MKSRTIEIIDNHIKALEEELEWYQEKNREWQEKCERLREQLRWHSANEIPPVDERYNDAISAGKVSVDVKTSTDNNKQELK